MRRLGRLSSRTSAKSPTGQAIRIALGLLLLSGAVAGTSASFNASTTNPAATIANDALYPPGALTAAGAGTGVTLTAAGAGSMGSGATTFGHRFRTANVSIESGVRDGQDPPACTSATTFTSTVANTTNAVLTTTHSSAATGTNAGSWQCYMVDTQYPQGASPLWFSQTVNANQVAIVQLGNVVRSVVFTDGPTTAAGTFGQGDSVTFTFSQPVNNTTGPTGGFCIRQGNNTFNIGRTSANTTTCVASETVWGGKVTGITVGAGGSSGWPATWVWGSCISTACLTLTGTAGARSAGTADATFNLATGSPIFTPTTVAAKLTSSTSALAICATANSATLTCIPTPISTGGLGI